jgi:hydroxyethylthiazole kinase
MDFEAYKKYMAALQFWDQVPGLPDSTVWHFQPLHFIEQFKKCHWLSKDELVAVFPESIQAYGETRENHRVHLNRLMKKYGIENPTRMSYMLAQVQQESGGLAKSLEGISDERANAQYGGRQDLGNTEPGDGARFKGRGMKQLTGRYNYMNYWVYRGWLDSSWLGKRWFFSPAEKKKSDAEKAESKKSLDPPPPISTPEDAEKPFNAVDTGGYYWLNGAGEGSGRPISRRLREGMIDQRTANAVSKDVNPYEKGEPAIRREFNTYRIWDVLGDDVDLRFDSKVFSKALEPYQQKKKEKKK